MTRFKRPAAAAGAAALLAFSLSACGGSDAADAPTDASKDEFCDGWNAVYEPLAEAGSGDPTEEQFDKFKEEVEALADIGTPEEMSDEAREGFEVFVDAVSDSSFDDFDSAEGDNLPGVSEDDTAKAQAFVEYAVTECLDLGDLEDLPTDVPTE